MLPDEQYFDGRIIDLESLQKVHSIELIRKDIDILELIIRFQISGVKSRMTLVCDLSKL